MIQLTNVSKDYKTKAGMRRVLNNINLTIYPGQRVGILGFGSQIDPHVAANS